MATVNPTDGPNRYGPPPPPNGALVIAVGLVVLLLFVAVMAAVAIPAYKRTWRGRAPLSNARTQLNADLSETSCRLRQRRALCGAAVSNRLI
jgi:hypothetical protein